MMNKKEQAAYDALADQVAKLQFEAKAHQLINRALRWTGPVQADVAPPAQGLSKGFLPNRHTGKVSPACSSSVSHCATSDTHPTTQCPVWVYSTRSLALRAVRHEMEDEFARRLAAIDAEIEKEADAF